MNNLFILLLKLVLICFFLLALNKIQNKFDMEIQEVQNDHQETTYKNVQHGLRSRFNAIFGGIHFSKQEYPSGDSII